MATIRGLLAALLVTALSVTALTVVGIAVAPSAQAARTIAMAGDHEEDTDAKVTWKTVVKKGKARSVKKVKFSRLTFGCTDESTIEVAGRIKGPVKVDRTFDGTVREPIKRKGYKGFQFNLTFDNNTGTKGYGSVVAEVSRPGGVKCYADDAIFFLRKR